MDLLNVVQPVFNFVVRFFSVTLTVGGITFTVGGLFFWCFIVVILIGFLKGLAR